MNYIEQINVFWKLDAEHSFNGNESRLYFYLLHLSNSLYWKNPLTNADGYTATMVGISVNTLKAVRNRLQQAGLISFKPGGSGARNKCQYSIVPAVQVLRYNANKVSNSDTLLDGKLTPYSMPGLSETDDIYKLKPDKTKQNGIATDKPSPPKKTNPAKKEIEAEPYWDALVKVWFDFNIEKFKREPSPDLPEGCSGKPSFERDDPRIFKRLINRLKTRAGVYWTEEKAPVKLKTFLEAAYADQWLSANFLLNNLEKQFDKIVLNQSQNGNQHRTDKQDYSNRPVITGTATGAGKI